MTVGVRRVEASPSYPAIVASVVGAEKSPPCTVCHETPSGGFGTATVTFVNSTQLGVTIKANTTKGTYNLTVTNPDGSKVVATGAIVNQ